MVTLIKRTTLGLIEVQLSIRDDVLTILVTPHFESPQTMREVPLAKLDAILQTLIDEGCFLLRPTTLEELKQALEQTP